MLRLSVLLCAAMFTTLLIAGKDGGQMRPGLAAAVAEGREIVVIERSFAEPVALAANPVAVDAAPMAAAAPEPAPQPAAEPVPVVEVAYTPEAQVPVAEPVTRRVIPEPVFTLSALPGGTGDAASIREDVAEQAPAEPGAVWYVVADKVNVRQGPSTDASVVGKLTGGEAVTVLASADDEWVQILIEGDGLEGYVAARFLSTSAP